MGEAKRRRQWAAANTPVGEMSELLEGNHRSLISDMTSCPYNPTPDDFQDAVRKHGKDTKVNLFTLLSHSGVDLNSRILVSGFMPPIRRSTLAGAQAVSMVLRIPRRPYFLFCPIIPVAPSTVDQHHYEMFDTDGLGVIGTLVNANGVIGMEGVIHKHADAFDIAMEENIPIFLMPDWNVDTMNLVGKAQGVQFR